MAAWMLFVAAMTALAAAGALAAERALALLRLPTRWVWAAALAVSLLAPLFVSPEPVGPRIHPAGASEPAAAPAPPRIPRMGPAEVREPPPYPTADAVAFAVRAASGWASAGLLAAFAAAIVVLCVRRRRWEDAEVDGVRVLVTERTGPAVAGFLAPVVVLPRRVLALPEPMLRMVVRHEREHVRGRDPLLLLLALAVVVTAPWNPALWWMLHRLRLAMEMDCDARTLRHEGDVAAYGRLLLEVGAFHRPCGVPVVSFAETRSFLERRIRRITARAPRRAGRRAAGWAALAAAAGIVAWSVPAPAAPGAVPLFRRQMEPEYPPSAFVRDLVPYRVVQGVAPAGLHLFMGGAGQATGRSTFTNHERSCHYRGRVAEDGPFSEGAFLGGLQTALMDEARAAGMRVGTAIRGPQSFRFDYAADGHYGVVEVSGAFTEEMDYQVECRILELAGPPGSRPRFREDERRMGEM
jgi:hypothetical protein